MEEDNINSSVTQSNSANGLQAKFSKSGKGNDLIMDQDAYYELYQNAPDMMISAESNSRLIISCNKAVTHFLGYERSEVIGRNIMELYHPDCHSEVNKIYEEYLNSGFVNNVKLILAKKSGEKMNVALSARAIRNDNGEITHSNSTWRDISDLVSTKNALRKANEKLASKLNETEIFLTKVTEIAPSIIYVFDQVKMANAYSNKEIGAVLGYSVEEIHALGEMLIPSLCHPDDLEKVFEHFGNIKALVDEKTITLEYRMRHKDGRYRWLLSEDTVFERSEKGEVTKHIGIATDISVLKETQEQLKVQSVRLEDQYKDLKQLAYLATHDLKSPMVSIQGHFDFLKDKLDRGDPLIDESIGFVKSGINQFHETVTGLSKAMELKEGHLIKKNIDLNLLIKEITDTYQSRVKVKGGTINTDLEKSMQVFSSDIYLKSILENLISNSIKYRSLDRNLKIDIKTVRTDEGVTLEYSDNGVGIDLELHKDRIFKMFSRFHENIEGNGMGLYMVKTMVEKLSGTIKIASVIGEGTDFTIFLKK